MQQDTHCKLSAKHVHIASYYSLALSRQRSISHRNQSIICSASQRTGFYMIVTSVIKSSSVRNERFPMRKAKEFVNPYTFISIPQSIPAFHNIKYYMLLLIIPPKINPLAIYCAAPVSYCKENNFLIQKEKSFQVPKFQKKNVATRNQLSGVSRNATHYPVRKRT